MGIAGFLVDASIDRFGARLGDFLVMGEREAEGSAFAPPSRAIMYSATPKRKGPKSHAAGIPSKDLCEAEEEQQQPIPRLA
jgi:hypothetical protein